MAASKSDEALYREFLEYLRQRKKKRQRSPFDPFALLERLISRSLRLTERAVARLIRAIVR